MMKEVGTHAIKTERLLLRRFVESDIKPYYDNYGCDQAVQEYIAWFDCKTLDDTENFVHEHLKKYFSMLVCIHIERKHPSILSMVFSSCSLLSNSKSLRFTSC